MGDGPHVSARHAGIPTTPIPSWVYDITRGHPPPGVGGPAFKGERSNSPRSVHESRNTGHGTQVREHGSRSTAHYSPLTTHYSLSTLETPTPNGASLYMYT